MRLCSPKVGFAVAVGCPQWRVLQEGFSKVSQVDPWRRRYLCVFRGGVSESDLWRRSCVGVSRGGVRVNDLWRPKFIGVCGCVCVRDLWRPSDIGVGRGGACEGDLCQVRVSYKSVK